jgi:hypothetical protein
VCVLASQLELFAWTAFSVAHMWTPLINIMYLNLCFDIF